MAKKVRKKAEEEKEPAFEFPEFDEAGFVWKEYELFWATLLAGLFAFGIGVVSWVQTAVGLPYFVPLPVGFALIIGALLVIGRVRTGSSTYTKGDWAALFMLNFFGWVAVWFVLVNLVPTI